MPIIPRTPIKSIQKMQQNCEIHPVRKASAILWYTSHRRMHYGYYRIQDFRHALRRLRGRRGADREAGPGGGDRQRQPGHGTPAGAGGERIAGKHPRRRGEGGLYRHADHRRGLSGGEGPGGAGSRAEGSTAPGHRGHRLRRAAVLSGHGAHDRPALSGFHARSARPVRPDSNSSAAAGAGGRTAVLCKRLFRPHPPASQYGFSGGGGHHRLHGLLRLFPAAHSRRRPDRGARHVLGIRRGDHRPDHAGQAV